jgi:hypothetical protein
MLEIRLDAIASCLNFAGGVTLAVDALSVQSRTRQEHGANRFISAAQEVGDTDLLKDHVGKPINSNRSIQNWFNRGTFRLAVSGFVLLVLGFGLDLFCKVFADPSLIK